MLATLIALVLALSTPCATEDATNCLWDADTLGAPGGRSFVDIRGTAYYLDDSR